MCILNLIHWQGQLCEVRLVYIVRHSRTECNPSVLNISTVTLCESMKIWAFNTFHFRYSIGLPCSMARQSVLDSDSCCVVGITCLCNNVCVCVSVGSSRVQSVMSLNTLANRSNILCVCLCGQSHSTFLHLPRIPGTQGARLWGVTMALG